MPRCGPPGPEFIARSRSTRGLLSLGCSQVFGGINTTPIVLVPGFWLGAWAWDEVAAALRAKGHEVTTMTLPGLESADADRSAITFADHVDAICEAVRAAGRPVVLAVHSAAGAPGYAVTDRIPEQIAAMMYVDTGPAKGALDPDFDAVEKPLPSREELAEEENLDGLTEEQLETFQRRAGPEPGAPLREAPAPNNEPRPHGPRKGGAAAGRLACAGGGRPPRGSSRWRPSACCCAGRCRVMRTPSPHTEAIPSCAGIRGGETRTPSPFGRRSSRWRGELPVRPGGGC